MTRKSKKKREKGGGHRKQAVQPAPMLFKRSVSLSDAVELNSSSVLGSGFG
jgi:hypothetical protein